MAEFKYREYRLSVETHTPGFKILIYPPGSSLPLPTIPFHRDRAKLNDLIEDAKHVVKDHQLMTGRLAVDNVGKGSRAPSWWLGRFRR